LPAVERRCQARVGRAERTPKAGASWPMLEALPAPIILETSFKTLVSFPEKCSPAYGMTHGFMLSPFHATIVPVTRC